MLANADYTAIELLATGGELEALEDPQEADVVEVTAPFLSNDEYMQVQLWKGMRGRVHRVDGDGDLQIFFPDLLPYGLPAWFSLRFVMQQQFSKMKRKRMPSI